MRQWPVFGSIIEAAPPLHAGASACLPSPLSPASICPLASSPPQPIRNTSGSHQRISASIPLVALANVAVLARHECGDRRITRPIVPAAPSRAVDGDAVLLEH